MITLSIIVIVIILVLFQLDPTIYRNKDTIVLYYDDLKGERNEIILWQR